MLSTHVRQMSGELEIDVYTATNPNPPVPPPPHTPHMIYSSLQRGAMQKHKPNSRLKCLNQNRINHKCHKSRVRVKLCMWGKARI